MASRDRGRFPRGRGRLGGGWISYIRRLIINLLNEGYTKDEIISILTGRPITPDPEPEPEPEPEPPKPDKVKLESFDLKVEENKQAHHTDPFDQLPDSVLVVRRGQPFSLHLSLSPPAPLPDTHTLRLIFEIGDTPNESKGTRVSLPVTRQDRGEDGQWSASLVSKGRQSPMEVQLLSPPDCFVGKWRLTAELVKKGQPKPVSRLRVNEPVYMLFNPWCPEDAVYMEDEEELKEYVLADTGCIFVGNSWSSHPRPWIFGQFEEEILDCCMYLLESSGLSMDVRGDPVKISRKMSARVNSNDMDGILTGNWSGSYGSFTNPVKWVGSTKILQKYYATKSPVKYGQCWVFSGVLTTVCRALGIPCRSVTNFDSAHDHDASTTIDILMKADGDRLPESDSIWNFHVWNDVWMRRDDLPDGYGGWQALDATPQEASEDVMQCGPCPLRAIKEGDMHILYDAPFIFAEVNGDQVIWQKDKDTTDFTVVSVDKNAVGKKMSTRALERDRNNPANVRDKKRHEVTHLYKYPEGSPEERAAVLKAYRKAPNPRRNIYDLGPVDVELQLQFDVTTKVGQSFAVSLQCKNTSRETRTLSGQGTISTVFYTGSVADEMVKTPFRDIKLRPGASQVVEVTVTPQQYRGHLVDGCFLTFTFVVHVEETNQSAIKMDTIGLVKPELSIKAPVKGKVGEQFDVTVSFTNPMPWTLTDCNLEVEGPGITKSQEYPQGDVPAGGTFMAKVTLKPRKKGQRTIDFVFLSKELDNITGEHDIYVSA